jgi:hypothetical protein
MRPEIFDKDDQLIENLKVEGGEAAVLSRIVAKPLQGWGNLDCPNPNYCPDELLREMISRLRKGGVVFFEEEHQMNIAEFLARRIERHPRVFQDPFRGFIVVMDDPYRSCDLAVRFFPKP